MRICIIGIQNLKHMSLISLYTSIFDANNINYDLIYIDKYGVDEKSNATQIYKFDGTKKKYQSKLGKLIKAYDYKRYVINILDLNIYDFIIVWREETACIFAKYLAKKYKNKYVVNIRDLWSNKNLFMTKRIQLAVQNSLFNTVSSEGFLKFIPKSRYLMIHSANKEIIKKHSLIIGKNNNLPIKITYIGTVRFYDYCFKLVDFFANDERFEINFIGQGSEKIEEYVQNKKIKNIFCVGQFEVQDTISLLKGTHIINCAFGSKNLAEKMLIPIRFYYAIYGNIPVLTVEDTWLDELASNLNMALTLPKDFSKSKITADDIYYKYKKLDFFNMRKKIKNYQKEIDRSHIIFEKIMNRILNKK